MVEKKVAIIGAGLGGLSAAIRLRKLGYDVHVYEQNSSAGGKAGIIKKDGFKFDTGPSLLTMVDVLDDLFKSVDSNIDEYLNLIRLDTICKYQFADGTVINAFSDIEKFAEEIERNTNDRKEDVIKYLNYCEKIYELSADLFLSKSFTEASTFLNKKALKTLLQINRLDTNRTMHEANKYFFNDEKTIQLFDRYATYNGSNPFLAPATLNIIQHVEYNLGGYLPKDGIYSITNALYNLAQELEVKFNFNSRVEEIIVDSHIVKGIKVNGNEYDYDIVISNSDVNNTYNNLLNDNKSKSSIKYSKIEKSSSALVFYWGIIGIHNNLDIHNILFSDNYEKEFDELFVKKNIPSDPTIYIYISSKMNEDHAPPGCENWFVMINVPHDNGQDWDSEIEKVKSVIKNKIKTHYNIEVDKNLLYEEILTPKIIEQRTSSIGGSIYGISSNNKMAAFLRQKNKSKEYKGLYFCGGSAHPGGGIPLVLLSGKIVSELIEKYEGL